jgi:thiamine pyrophosphate-dependent acetolactate synthase large subunit-like protein
VIAAETNFQHSIHINPPDFVKVAEFVGGYGEQVTDPENFMKKRSYTAKRLATFCK